MYDSPSDRETGRAPSGARPLLETSHVAKRYGSVVALRSADLVVRPGEIHALLGANGAGKSTLVKILSGVIGADAGSISVNGRPVQLRKPTDAMHAGLATVFQDPALIPDLTVDQNLRLTGIEAGVVREWLERMELGISISMPTSATCRCRLCACWTWRGRWRMTHSC